MSGFFGILRSDGQEVSPVLMEEVARVLRLRGPDGEAIRTPPGVATCFTYLATGPAKQAIQQPVTLGGNWLLGDIRVDARSDLMDQLAKDGAKVPVEATSEDLILQAWQTWGESCLERLLGDFSFALWDRDNQSLWCARDFVGPRPFYYADCGGVFCFSNSLEAVRTVPEISSDLDEAFIGEFLLHAYCSDLTRTVYSQIRRLPAGHLLKYKNQSVEVRRFLALPVEAPHRFSHPEEYLKAYSQVLHQAVKDRLPEKPTALYLSGGLDSGSVCGVAARIAADRGNKENLKAFTVGWRPLFADPEPEFAELTAKHLGLTHQILEEQNFVPFARSEDSEGPAVEPDFEPFYSHAQKQYRQIAWYSSVILSGDGGDDVLTGHPWHYFVNLWRSGKWPKILGTIGSFAWAHGRLPPLRAGIRAKLRGLLNSGSEWDGYPEWLNPEFESRNDLRAKWSVQQPVSKQQHPIHPQAYAALHHGYWSTVLESEDAGNTGVALETRAPLLDLRVLRFLLRVPPVPWCVNKELTRRAMMPYLPDKILRRPKTPMPRDPLQACQETGRWSPVVPAEPPTVIHRYINWHKWTTTLESSKGYDFYGILYPFALVSWLKDIENA